LLCQLKGINQERGRHRARFYQRKTVKEIPRKLTEKLAKDLNKYFTKQEIQMSDKHIKMCHYETGNTRI
jgi:hypothetical protein